MTVTVKAVPTTYAGIEFRSRLEARTAMLLNQHQLDWHYEAEAFELSDGTRYMPDFWLPKIGTYIEVKGQNVPGVEKAERFAADLTGENGRGFAADPDGQVDREWMHPTHMVIIASLGTRFAADRARVASRTVATFGGAARVTLAMVKLGERTWLGLAKRSTHAGLRRFPGSLGVAAPLRRSVVVGRTQNDAALRDGFACTSTLLSWHPLTSQATDASVLRRDDNVAPTRHATTSRRRSARARASRRSQLGRSTRCGGAVPDPGTQAAKQLRSEAPGERLSVVNALGASVVAMECSSCRTRQWLNIGGFICRACGADLKWDAYFRKGWGVDMELPRVPQWQPQGTAR